jgi:hypothetical protein
VDIRPECFGRSGRMYIDTRSMFKSQAGDFVDLVGAGGACASAVAPDCRRTDDRCFDVFRV